MSQPLYIRRDNQVKGPFPPGQISQALLIGRFRLTDEVSSDRDEWKPIKACPELIPEVLKGDPNDPAYQERLAAARRWADERRPSHTPHLPELRRAPESFETLEYRAHRESVYKLLSQRRDVAIVQVVIVFLLVTALIYWGFSFMPQPQEGESQCQAPAAPGVDWRSCRLAGIQAIKSNLTGAKLNSAILIGANLFGSELKQAVLDYADLSVSNLSFVNFSQASLKGVNLQQADLTQADLQQANLSYANLTGARLEGARLNGAILDNAIWIDGRTCLPGSVGGCKTQG